MLKITPRAFQVMWDTHSVCGIVIGLALYVIFFTGAFSLFVNEIREWEDPSLRTASREVPSVDAIVQPVLDTLDAHGQDVLLQLPGPHRADLVLGRYDESVSPAEYNSVRINPETGAVVDGDARTYVGNLLLRLHFFAQLGPTGTYLAGLIALFMMLALTSGVIIHLHRLFKDFFQFRPRKKLRVAWADAHKLLGTIGLPFQLMYAFTGAFYGLLGLVIVPYALLVFDGDVEQLYELAGILPHLSPEAVDTSPASLSFDDAIARARATWPGFDVEFIQVHDYGEPDAYAEVRGRLNGSSLTGGGTLALHGATGDELARLDPHRPSPLDAVVQAFRVLHFAEFGGVLLRGIFFLLAMATCAVILTGNFVWLEVRHGLERRINHILASLTAGVASGIVPATALLFLANKALPMAASDRTWWEGMAFFASWSGCLIYAFARRHPGKAHRELLFAGGVLALLIPVANGIATGHWPWVSLRQGLTSVTGVDVTATLLGFTALVLGVLVKPRRLPPARAESGHSRLPAAASHASTQSLPALGTPKKSTIASPRAS